jgi:uncharacterized membrane protein (UPF0127 family)
MMTFRVEHNRHRLHRVQVHVCESRLERGRGLLLRRQIEQDEAWLLPGCRAVHTIGMHYRIDVVFCDREGRILSIRDSLAPCRIARDRGAAHVWELLGGTARRWGLLVGDRIRPC